VIGNIGVSNGKATISDVLLYSDLLSFEIGKKYGAIDLLDIVKRMIGTGEEIHDLEDFEYVVDDFLRVEI
jgi:hypothetical protein